MRFRDRRDAGEQLAGRLAQTSPVAPVVLGLPRGGVPVAVEVADRLDAPVDVFVARKVGAPGHEELGIGAIAEGSDQLVVTDTAARLGVDREQLDGLAEQARRELCRRVEAYCGDRPLPALDGRDVVLVDDGIATGVTAEAALRALRQRQPRRLILAVPVCSREAAGRMAALADEVVWVLSPATFFAVGEWYDDFAQIGDDEVTDLLAGSRHRNNVRFRPI